MGMSDRGSLSVTARDIGGLIEYVKLMVSGGGRAAAKYPYSGCSGLHWTG